jgi:hypothetical protein
LKALLLLVTFALGSMTVSGTILPFTFSDAHRTTGSFVLTVTPSPITIAQGRNATSTITILSIGGYTGTVSLSGQASAQGVLTTITPSVVTVPARGSASSTTIVFAAKNASIGTYNIIVTGTAVIGKKILTSSALLTAIVNGQSDFEVYAVPNTLIVVAGFSNATTIVLESMSGFNGTVSLSATVPFGFLGVMTGRNPVALAPGAQTNTTLQVSTTVSAMIGKYNITITGTSGGLSHTCVLTINVVDPAPESLKLAGYALNTPTSVILSLRNNGNTPLTLQSYTVTDSSLDKWTLANWTGPTVSPSTTSPALISIGTSCNTCIYSGVTGLFQQFLPGHFYTITVTTKLNNTFTFNIAA